ncbi:hypothetical protein BCR33DRAFT_714889 [Rhizoclosmatium globosum]|uniref:C2H2-type domain-containing protein n=1 Tax=Rhizoclosmatium globosum TaxID=329046 RepID=A0A1Y2CLD6_9FUNG|nr:hypothetical protein BCR33DRAFT_714889 [Rhizoclosmatium globosum]|eukprot:ORY47838.1 hypothetical protein BCR33DRAFT_714889 [Rhizoclosmatium globosum]
MQNFQDERQNLYAPAAESGILISNDDFDQIEAQLLGALYQPQRAQVSFVNQSQVQPPFQPVNTSFQSNDLYPAQSFSQSIMAAPEQSLETLLATPSLSHVPPTVTYRAGMSILPDSLPAQNYPLLLHPMGHGTRVPNIPSQVGGSTNDFALQAIPANQNQADNFHWLCIQPSWSKKNSCHDSSASSCGSASDKDEKYFQGIGSSSTFDPVECSVVGCGKSFPKLANLKQHTLKHTGALPYKCDYPDCDKRYNTRNRLNVHQCKHTGKFPHECPTCGHKYAQKCSLKTHLVSHMDPDEKRRHYEALKQKSVVCALCNLDQHSWTVHKGAGVAL